MIALAGAALRAAGHRVAETPKPHLVTYRERMIVDGRPIAPETFARLVSLVLPLAARIEAEHGPPTEFELLTAMLFRWFADEQVDVALVEVGLGGRLDATNAWDGGVAVVTNVRPRPHRPPRDDHPGDRAREGGDHQARRPRRHRGLG